MCLSAVSVGVTVGGPVRLCSLWKKIWCSLSHKKRIDPTCSSNNITKTLSGGSVGGVNPAFVRDGCKHSGLQPAAPKKNFALLCESVYSLGFSNRSSPPHHWAASASVPACTSCVRISDRTFLCASRQARGAGAHLFSHEILRADTALIPMGDAIGWPSV